MEVEGWSWPWPLWGVKVSEEIISTRQDRLGVLNDTGSAPNAVNIEGGAVAYVAWPLVAARGSSPDYFHRVRTCMVPAILCFKRAFEPCERPLRWPSRGPSRWPSGRGSARRGREKTSLRGCAPPPSGREMFRWRAVSGRCCLPRDAICSTSVPSGREMFRWRAVSGPVLSPAWYHM